MEKKRFGPKMTMDALPKGSKALVNFLHLPIPVQTIHDTGFNEEGKPCDSLLDGGGFKWEMPIYLKDHPTQEARGAMFWQTTATVIRVEIMNLINGGTKKDTENLLNDLKSCEWNITCDNNGRISIEEV
jgi:hypothetical protein